jgi:hypothetical protein
MPQQHLDGLVVPVERGLVQRRVPGRLIDGRVAIVSHVDDRQPGTVAHDRAQEGLEHRTRRAAAGVDEEPGPAPVVGSRQELRVLGKEPLDHFVASQDDCRRERANAAGEEQACRVGVAVQRRLIERREPTASSRFGSAPSSINAATAAGCRLTTARCSGVRRKFVLSMR